MNVKGWPTQLEEGKLLNRQVQDLRLHAGSQGKATYDDLVLASLFTSAVSISLAEESEKRQTFKASDVGKSVKLENGFVRKLISLI